MMGFFYFSLHCKNVFVINEIHPTDISRESTLDRCSNYLTTADFSIRHHSIMSVGESLANSVQIHPMSKKKFFF